MKTTHSTKKKNTTPHISTRAELDEFIRRKNAEQRAAEMLTQHFGTHSVGIVPPIDAVLMDRLHEALDPIDDDLQTACFQRGLLSMRLQEALRMICFLSVTLPLARAAQAATGVPASVLVAEAYQVSGAWFYGCRFQWNGRSVNDVFETGSAAATLQDAFINHAHSLKKQKRFQPVMRAAGNPTKYLEQLAHWSTGTYNTELVTTITDHDLTECDRMRPAVY